MNFHCTKCGACCRRVHKIDGFPEPVREDGSCAHLKDDNSCAIYENRPLICRVEELFESAQKEFKPGMSREEYFRKNSELCNKFMDEDGVDQGLRIDLKIYD